MNCRLFALKKFEKRITTNREAGHPTFTFLFRMSEECGNMGPFWIFALVCLQLVSNNS